jgi:hypothetical protein
MKIILIHSLGQLTVTTPNNDPDEIVAPELASDSEASELLEELFKAALEDSAGHYGHIIDPDNVSNLDLQAACYKLDEFEVVEIEPPITPSELPEDAIP